METITIKPIFHRNAEQAAIFFKQNNQINDAIKKVEGIKWSQTHRCWYLPLTQEAYKKVAETLKPFGRIETTELRSHLELRKNKSIATSPLIKIDQSHQSVQLKISSINKHVLSAMKEQLKLKAYSPSTIRTYLNEMAQLLQTLGNIPADELEPQHLKRYLIYCFEKLGSKENTLHSRINAMKFYYEQVLRREKFFWEIPRPKKQLNLPKILSEAEIGRLFKAIGNIKHKAIVLTAYSAGLRVSEVINLRIQDVDSGRMTLFIQRAKGKKDRIVNLSPLLLDILRKYLLKYKPRPKIFLFEGATPGEQYSIRSAQQIFNNAKQKAGIKKEITFHSLRHSFATHLLEKGVDIRYIKDILGHFDIKTTERYTHVSKRMLVNIGSPLDDLAAKGFID